MAWIPAASAGVSAIGGLLGSGKQDKSQSQASNAAAGLYSAEEQAIQQLLNNYFQEAPTIEKGLTDFPQTAWNQDQGLITQLGNTLGSSNQSLVQDFTGRLGGVANPGSVLGGLTRSNQESQLSTVQGLGANIASQLTQEDLQALEALANFVQAPVSSGLSGLNSMGNTYANAASSGGNPWASGIGSITNLLGALAPKGGTAENPSAAPNANWTYQPAPPAGLPAPSAASLGWGQTGGVNLNPYQTQGPQTYVPGFGGPG